MEVDRVQWRCWSQVKCRVGLGLLLPWLRLEVPDVRYRAHSVKIFDQRLLHKTYWPSSEGKGIRVYLATAADEDANDKPEAKTFVAFLRQLRMGCFRHSASKEFVDATMLEQEDDWEDIQILGRLPGIEATGYNGVV